MEDFEMQELLCGSVYHKNYVHCMMNRVALMYNWCSDPDALNCVNDLMFYRKYGKCDAIIFIEPIDGTDLVCVFVMRPEELEMYHAQNELQLQG